MSLIIHHAIIVVGARDGLVEAYERARELGLTVSSTVQSPYNVYLSFLVAPDGSKEGWVPSNEADARRLAFLDWLADHGKTQWVEVGFSDDTGAAEVTASSAFVNDEMTELDAARHVVKAARMGQPQRLAAMLAVYDAVVSR